MSVVISQSDLVTAYGWGLNPIWTGLLQGKNPIQSSDRFASHNFVSNQMALVPDLEIKPDESRVLSMLARLLKPLIGKLDPKTPLILATTVGEIEYVERAVLHGPPTLAEQSRPNFLLARAKQLLGLTGPAMVVSSACASSTAALTRAASMIQHGQAKDVLVITSDAVSEFVYSGFSTLLSLCDTPARPFDAHRTGLTLGEAAAWALLSSDDSPQAKNATTKILGWGNTTDAVHMTAPDRAANGLSRAIAKACAMADRSAADIAFIAAHGTATLYSDAMEMLAFRGATSQPKPIFSVKGAIGHTLAAAGLVQILIAQKAMSEKIVPPTIGLATPDPAATGWAHNTAVQLNSADLALSTNSGFGGVNSAIILGRRTTS